MTVTTYNTPTDPYHMIKDISSVTGTYSGNVRGAVSVDRPVIEVSGTEITGNYAFVDTFNRFYWIVDRVVLRTGLTQLSLRSDPLHSFAATIRNLPVYVTRTEQESRESNGNTGYNVYIPDRTVQKTARTYTKVTIDQNIPVFQYPETGLTPCYILGVIG